MAYLYRLIVAFFLVFPVVASAAFTTTTSYRYSNFGTTWQPTRDAACTSAFNNANAANASIGGLKNKVFNATTFACTAQYQDNTGLGSISFGTATSQISCSGGAVYSGGVCACPSGQVDNAGVCGAPIDPNTAHCNSIAGSPVKTSWTSTAPSLSTRTVCVTNAGFSCNATIEPDFCGSSDGVTSVCHGSGVSAAGVCAPSPTPETPVAPTAPVSELPSPPPPGTCPGQVNGVTVNVPCNDSVSKGTKSESSDDGAGNTTTKTESRSTTCTAAGSCSTTVTTVTSVNGGAPVTSTKTSTETKGEFCVGNPAAKECGDGEGSSFGGSCESGFVCEGDAVQCAHAKETHLQNCKINKDTPERQLYESSKGDDADFDNDQVVNVGPSSFSQAPILGAASCISDKSITVMGETVSLPFSRVCQYLAMLGNVLMAVGFLLSGRIIMRG